MRGEGRRGKSTGPSQEMDRPGKIIVTGIPKDDTYSEADLEKEFAVYGRITEAYIVRDRKDKRSNKSRGFAFITYENPKDAADAIKAMEGKNLGGDRIIHCEQAFVVPRKSDDNSDDSPKGRGPERGRGRGEGRGRGMERGWRGGDRGMRGGRGGGRGMEWDEYGDDPRGGNGFRGGMMRGRGEGMRGRGRGDFFEPEMQGDDFYEHGPLGPHDMLRGRPGRRTLLPNPGFRGGRGQGPPPRGRGGPLMMRGGNDYYEEGPEGYFDPGERREAYNEGYDEGYQEEYYDDPQPYPERMPPRGGPGGGRGGRPVRGRGMPPEGMQRDEGEYPYRGEEYPARRGMGGGGDYGGRGSVPMRRGGPSNLPEDYLPPKRQMGDYGYPADEGPARRKEALGRGPSAQYPDDDYEYDSPHARRSDYYDVAPRGRGVSGARGARGPPAPARGASVQRRGPLLGHDPYAEDGSQGYYDVPPPQSKASERFEDDGYPHPRGGGQPPARRRPPGGDDGYGYDAPPAKSSQMYDDGYSQKRGNAGPGMYDQSYQEEAHDTGRRREEYDNVRQSGMRRSEVEYPSAAEDYPHRGSDMYASYSPRARGTMESRDAEADPYGRKRHLAYDDDVRMTDVSEVRRDYQDFHDRPAPMQAGPSASKRERYDGFYQPRQEEVYREL